MDFYIKLLTSRDFLIAALAAVSVAAIVFTLGGQFIVRSDMKDRIKRVALEREKLRAEEMARLRGQSGQNDRGTVRREDASKDYMKRIVERFSLQKAFAEATEDGFVGTDEASVVERAGNTVAVVPGSPVNLKITQPGDLELAEFYLRQRG